VLTEKPLIIRLIMSIGIFTDATTTTDQQSYNRRQSNMLDELSVPRADWIIALVCIDIFRSEAI
jgi:hypothetical protein